MTIRTSNTAKDNGISWYKKQNSVFVYNLVVEQLINMGWGFTTKNPKEVFVNLYSINLKTRVTNKISSIKTFKKNVKVIPCVVDTVDLIKSMDFEVLSYPAAAYLFSEKRTNEI